MAPGKLTDRLVRSKVLPYSRKVQSSSKPPPRGVGPVTQATVRRALSERLAPSVAY
jgi:hypothetical protein